MTGTTSTIVNGRAVVFPATVCGLVYHTTDSVDPHAEGDEYTVSDPALFETLIAIGFVHYEPAP
jgi:hypothetical protein